MTRCSHLTLRSCRRTLTSARSISNRCKVLAMRNWPGGIRIETTISRETLTLKSHLNRLTQCQQTIPGTTCPTGLRHRCPFRTPTTLRSTILVTWRTTPAGVTHRATRTQVRQGQINIQPTPTMHNRTSSLQDNTCRQRATHHRLGDTLQFHLIIKLHRFHHLLVIKDPCHPTRTRGKRAGIWLRSTRGQTLKEARCKAKLLM